MNEYIRKLLAREQEENVQREKIRSNEQYISWLVEFTNKHSGFSDDDWLYKSSEISEYDNQMVNNLHLLFQIIANYANQNYIYPVTVPLKFAESYRIRYGNNGFEIGVLHGQGTIFWCNRIEIDNEKEFIDFFDIINNNKAENTDHINQILQHIAYKIIEVYKKEVPLAAIRRTVDITLETIEEIERNKKVFETNSENANKIYNKIKGAKK